MTPSLTVHVTTTRRSPITYLPINLDHLHFHIRMMYMIPLRHPFVRGWLFLRMLAEPFVATS